ncbi:trace amine-associated receptor 13c-like [Rhinichthys klamathensis goyatoka]|uniref:trace amine-associated receptor 13c-like n=1 Tax=Rhinichthys klamathensis goyatoka TaxID=3034132 RepID=UPI0024B56D21|nr:trace amine-associated receptor 13c-like [Rhinichthys klamathensis goyatoka]
MAYETEDHETQYCFPAINSSCIKGKRSSFEHNIIYIFVSLLSAWTVFLNLLVIISISHFKKLHTPTNLIILSLAVADLLIGLIVIPIEGIKQIETCWYFGDTYCGLYVIIVRLLLSSSLSNLVLIAVDRYMAVCYSLLYPQKITATKTLISICLCWFCCLVYNIWSVISNGYFNMSDKTMCYGQCIVLITPAWRFTDFIFTFLFPCTVIITTYLRIFYVAHQQVKVINTQMNGVKFVMEVSVRRKSESKAALTLGIIVTAYLLCWIPFYICSLTKTTTISSTTMTFLLWTFHINSGLNPIVYALFYSWFKISVKRILTLRIFQPASSLMDIFIDCHS